METLESFYVVTVGALYLSDEPLFLETKKLVADIRKTRIFKDHDDALLVALAQTGESNYKKITINIE